MLLSGRRRAGEFQKRGKQERGMRGFSIRIFLPDGVPDGLRIIEKSNWTGLGVICPRPLLSEVMGREEFTRTGVYVLSGPSESGGLPGIYVGEAESIRPRLEQHAIKKDFWTSATFFVSKDDNLNKAHVQYLEARLVSLAREAKRCEMNNAIDPNLPSLSEADRADIEGFLDEMLLCLPILGLNVFEQPSSPHPTVERFTLTGIGTDVSGYESANGFVVCAGSKARGDEVPSIPKYASGLRQMLLEQGVLVVDGDQLRLAQDYEFNSPSTAASVMLGRSANGRVELKDAEGKTLKERQEAGEPEESG